MWVCGGLRDLNLLVVYSEGGGADKVERGWCVALTPPCRLVCVVPASRGEPGSLGLLAKLISLPLSPFPLEPQSRAAGGREAVDQLIVLNLSTQILLSAKEHG